jgi:hypothetical protein
MRREKTFRDTGSLNTSAMEGWNEGGGGGNPLSKGSGKIKESVTYFLLSFVQRKAFILYCVSRRGIGNVTIEISSLFGC